MTTTVLTKALAGPFSMDSLANTTLKAATRFWFAVTVIGQLAFGFTVGLFYGLTALRGDYHGWQFTNGFIPGVTKGNIAVVTHLISAVVIMLMGAVQLVPKVRNRIPAFHRWNGRIYMLAAVALSGAGVYMHWIRGSMGDFPQHVGGTVNAVLIWLCVAMALRYALIRDFATHRRWALRLYIVVSASWFLRIMLSLTLLVFKGPFGFDPNTFTGPYLTFLSFAQYLIPLGVLELYFQALKRPGAWPRLASAGMLFVVTLAMAAGLFGVATAVWVPQVKAGFDRRSSIGKHGDRRNVPHFASGELESASSVPIFLYERH